MEVREILALLCFLMAAIYLFRSADTIKEAIDNFANHFRGGPPTPMHPSSANDGPLLRKRSRKTES